MHDAMSAIHDYANKALGPDSDAYHELLKELQDEVLSRRVRLTDYVGPTPAFLSPAMSRWYARFVNPYRRAALDCIERSFGHVRKEQDAGGVFLEHDLDKIDDDRLTKKRSVRASHIEQNPAKYQRLSELQEEYARAKRTFADLQAEKGGRPPQITRWWYWLLLIGVGIADLLINFSAFKAIKLMPSPAVALGSTLVVAFLLALASHLHGTLTRQAKVYLGPHRDDIDRRHAIKIFSLGTSALSFVLAAVWYARDSYLTDIIMEIATVGGETPSWWRTVGGSLSLNLGVYVAGVILAFLCHDEDPAYPRAFRMREAAGHSYRSVEEGLSRPLRREFERIDAQAELDRQSARARDTTLSHLDTYQAARRALDRVASKDAEVLGALEAYRGALARDGLRNGLVIEMPSVHQKEMVEVIDTGEYAAKRLALKWI